jgi:hypothetical protein
VARREGGRGQENERVGEQRFLNNCNRKKKVASSQLENSYLCKDYIHHHHHHFQKGGG